MKESFKQVVDRRLDSLTFAGKEDAALRGIHRRIAQETQQPRRRVKRTTAIALGFLAALLLAATAFAVVELVFSREVDAELVARHALMDKYGLTNETLGLFVPQVKETEDGWQVTYVWNTNAMRQGFYTVRVPKSGQAVASWSHDDADKAVWENGDMEAPVWGQKQLETYIRAKANTEDEALQAKLTELTARDSRTFEERAAQDALIEQSLPEDVPLYRKHVLPGAGDLTVEEARKLAADALAERYLVTPQELEAQGYWLTETLTQDRDKSEPEYSFSWWNKALESITIDFSSKGEDIESYANVFPAGKLPDGALDGYERAVERYVKLGMLETLHEQERRGVEQRIREAGFDALLEPAAEDAAEAQTAIRAAAKALGESYGLTDEMLALFGASATRTQRDGREVWEVVFDGSPYVAKDDPYLLNANLSRFDLEKLGKYTVWLDPKTSEALDVEWSLAGVESRTFTRESWGEAQAYGADVLPWALELLQARAEIVAKYQMDEAWEYVSVADNAAVDQLFRDAGFDPAVYRHVLPTEGDLTQDEAWELFAKAIEREYGVTRAQMDASGIAYAELTQEPEGREWYFWIQNGETLESWTIVIDAQTGEIRELFAESTADGNG